MFPLAVRFEIDAAAWEEARRFLAALVDSRIDTYDLVFWGAILLGVTCGLLGCFTVLRRQSLLGDAIGHSVLPGVCIGFIVAGTKSTPALLLGALIAGLAAAGLIALLQRTTVLKSGECMGAVFTGFYALGIMLLTHIQQGHNIFARLGLMPQTPAGQAGLETFLFGQIATITETDLVYMAVLAGLTIAAVWLFWRMLAISSFDSSFAFSIAIPVRRVHYLLMVLLTVAIVISIQAVGVVLVAAMLIIPASTAYLLTDRLPRMAVLSAVLGAVAGVSGAFFSVIFTGPGRDLPTGASMVLAAGGLFTAAFLLAPRHGLLPRMARVWDRRRRTEAENLLRTLYLLWEKREEGTKARRHEGTKGAESSPPFDRAPDEIGGDEPHPTHAPVDRRFGVHTVAAARQESAAHVHRTGRIAARYGWIDRGSRDPLVLTDAGLDEARRIVRNHRLWELFLAQEAKLGHDQVHADAEYIEHVLPPDTLRRLEQMLEHPKQDPHGRPIPGGVE